MRQTVVVPAPPAAVFTALTDGETFAAVSGAPAAIESGAGGAFSCFGGMIEGRTLDSAPGERLVQAWRVKLWEAGQFSLVRFELSAVEGGTEIRLAQDAHPDAQTQSLADGWHANYRGPLTAHFEASAS
ncbi:MAG: SRPBCC domain-containing protein [Sandaracinaceae bacterium]